MYSKNDYRYYLEHRLLVSDDYLAHYGVMGMKWGVRHDERRASLVSKRDANTAKIATYQNKLNTVGAQKRAAKAAKYQTKVDKLQRKASKAEKKLAKGKNLSKSQMKKLMKYETYKAKVAKNSEKNDKYQMKISQLQAKNAKLDKKITKMDQPSRAGARAYQRGLNNLDVKRAKSVVQYNEIKSNPLMKSDRKKSLMSKQMSNITNYEKESRATVVDAKKRGYEISSKSVNRWTNPGESVALAALTTVAPMPIGYTVTKHTSGTKYKVKKKG